MADQEVKQNWWSEGIPASCFVVELYFPEELKFRRVDGCR